MSVVGLVLAAGAGRRMGGPKALLPRASDRNAVQDTVCRVRAAGADPVIVVLGACADEVSATLADHVIEVRAAGWESGMGASLQEGLRGAACLGDEVIAALVTLVDLPDVDRDVFARVLRVATDRTVLARAAYGGVPGHPVVLGRDHWAGVVATALGDRGARDYLATQPVTLVECGDLATGADTDHPTDLNFPA